MLKKVSLVLSVIAALGFAFVVSAPADAKEQQGGSKNVHVNKNVQVNKNVKVNKTVKERQGQQKRPSQQELQGR